MQAQVQVQGPMQARGQVLAQRHEQGPWLPSCGVAAESYVQLGLPLPAGDVWAVAGPRTQPFASVPGASGCARFQRMDWVQGLGVAQALVLVQEPGVAQGQAQVLLPLLQADVVQGLAQVLLGGVHAQEGYVF